MIQKLRLQRNRESTKRIYYSVWKKFNEFFVRLDVKPDTWEERLILFVGYLVETKKKSSTIKSYISAIKAVLRDDGVEVNENKYLLASLTKACRYINDTVRTRLPIGKSFLNILTNKINHVFSVQQNQPYLASLYKALFAMTYYGLFRISEVTNGGYPVLAKDVHIVDNKDKMLFIVRMSKTYWSDSKPQTVKITREKGNPFRSLAHCPYHLLRQYLKYRPDSYWEQEQFFIFSDKTPVTPSNFRSVLQTMLEMCGVEPSLYGTHSLRVGRSLDLLKAKISISKIKRLGRWKSNAVYRYLSIS